MTDPELIIQKTASGNLVCHPKEDQVSNTHTVRTEVQPNNALPDVLDGPGPITGIHRRCHRNSFEGTHNNI
jgi:hypothetical protein